MNTLIHFSRLVSKSKAVIRAGRSSQKARSQMTKQIMRAYATKATQKAAGLDEVHKDQVWTLPANLYADPKVSF